MSSASPRIRAVAFDVFGTLVHITDRRGPYRRLLNALEANGRPGQPEDGATIMSVNISLAEMPSRLGLVLPASVIADMERDLAAELASIRALPDALPTLQALKSAGYKVGLCSNLAKPYADPAKALLPDLDAYAWSFEIGAIKPDPRIYERLCHALGCEAGEVLMVGDTPEADYDGPRRFGMQALHLHREGKAMLPGSIDGLRAVLAWLGQ